MLWKNTAKRGKKTIHILITRQQHSYNTHSLDQIETYYCKTDTCKTDTSFPYTIVEWNKLDLDIRKSKSYPVFWNALLKIG